MLTEIRKLEEVYTTDDVRVGLAYYLYHRGQNVNPELQLFQTYLHVKNFDIGTDYYLPAEYIDGRDPATGRVQLTVPFREVSRRTWNRMPQFILAGQAKCEELAGEEVLA